MECGRTRFFPGVSKQNRLSPVVTVWGSTLLQNFPGIVVKSSEDFVLPRWLGSAFLTRSPHFICSLARWFLQNWVPTLCRILDTWREVPFPDRDRKAARHGLPQYLSFELTKATPVGLVQVGLDPVYRQDEDIFQDRRTETLPQLF